MAWAGVVGPTTNLSSIVGTGWICTAGIGWSIVVGCSARVSSYSSSGPGESCSTAVRDCTAGVGFKTGANVEADVEMSCVSSIFWCLESMSWLRWCSICCMTISEMMSTTSWAAWWNRSLLSPLIRISVVRGENCLRTGWDGQVTTSSVHQVITDDGGWVDCKYLPSSGLLQWVHQSRHAGCVNADSVVTGGPCSAQR